MEESIAVTATSEHTEDIKSIGNSLEEQSTKVDSANEKFIEHQIPEESESSHQVIQQDDSASSKIVISSLNDQIFQLQKALTQKDNVIALFEREKNILDKEKIMLNRNLDLANKEKETAVMRFAVKEKNLLDVKKEVENLEKQLNDAKKEIRNMSTKYHVLQDEKQRILSTFDEKCAELKKSIRDNEKLRTDLHNLELRIKWQSIKLSQEIEGKIAAEKKIEELQQSQEEKVTALVKVEHDANLILLKHENEKLEKSLDVLRKEYNLVTEKLSNLQEVYKKEKEQRISLDAQLKTETDKCNSVQNSFDQELLNSAKLRSQLEELKILQTKNVIFQENNERLLLEVDEKTNQITEFTTEAKQLREKESELMKINKEVSEKIVELQNEILLQNSKMRAIVAENDVLEKGKASFDSKLNDIAAQLEAKNEQMKKERIILTKHLSEKTKQCENMKKKLENALGDLEATKNKHSQVVKELHREINKIQRHTKITDKELTPPIDDGRLDTKSDTSSIPIQSDSENDLTTTNNPSNALSSQLNEPSNQHLIERILRLQQATARQAEKIDFLENHTMSLVSEIQKKSKVLQHYMLRDQAGALTSSKSDQHKSELAKYGGVMSAIYSGLKGSSSSNQSMTLDLSLEINRKLQAVLEDTLLKNITLKENLDMLGLEVDKLTRQISSQQNSINSKS